MENWTKLSNNWIVKSQNRLLNSNNIIGLDFRHMSCYKNTFIVHCMFKPDTIACIVCGETLTVNETDFESLKFAS